MSPSLSSSAYVVFVFQVNYCLYRPSHRTHLMSLAATFEQTGARTCVRLYLSRGYFYTLTPLTPFQFLNYTHNYQWLMGVHNRQHSQKQLLIFQEIVA